MKNRYLFVALIMVLAISLYIGSKTGNLEGTDDLANEAIADINPEYEPWVESLWTPPSGEIESALFAIQAAIGGAFIGYFIGTRKNDKRHNGTIQDK